MLLDHIADNRVSAARESCDRSSRKDPTHDGDPANLPRTQSPAESHGRQDFFGSAKKLSASSVERHLFSTP